MVTFDLRWVLLVLVAHARPIATASHGRWSARQDETCRGDERWDVSTTSCVEDCAKYDGEAPPTRSYFDPGTGLCAVVVACVTLDEGVVIREVRNNICTDVTEDYGTLNMDGMTETIEAHAGAAKNDATPAPCDCHHGTENDPGATAVRECSCTCLSGWQSPHESQQYNATDEWLYCTIQTGAHHSRPELGAGGEDTVEIDTTEAGSPETVAGQAATVVVMLLLCCCCFFKWPGCCRRCCWAGCCRHRSQDRDLQDRRIDRRIIRDIVRTERAQQHASHASHSPPAPMLPGPASTTACQPLPAAAPEFTIVLADGTTHTAHVATSAPITDVANTTTVSSAGGAAACKPRPAKPARPTRPAPQQRWKVSPPPPPVPPSQLGSVC